MKNIKGELQHIILGDEQARGASQLEKVQCFLRANAEASGTAEKRQPLKTEETTALITFAEKEGIIYSTEIFESDFIGEGAEQKVYRLDGTHVVKANPGIFYDPRRFKRPA